MRANKELPHITIKARNEEECRVKAAIALGADARDLEVQCLYEDSASSGILNVYHVSLPTSELDAPLDALAKHHHLDDLVKRVRRDLALLNSLEGDELSCTFEDLRMQCASLDDELQDELADLARLMVKMQLPNAMALANDVAQDGSLQLEISDDKMRVYLSLTPARGTGMPVTSFDLMRALWSMQITTGIAYEKLSRLLNQCNVKKRRIRHVVVAYGIPPEHGQDGYTEVCPEIKATTLSPKYADDKTQTVSHLAQVIKDMPLLRIVPPTAGNNGVDVCGTPLLATPGKAAVAHGGENTYLSKDGTTICAAIDGLAKFNHQHDVSVFPVYIVEHDLTSHIGNISFDGDVIVGGNVCDGVSIDASNDIRIHGRAESAILRSHKGCVLIEKGINGRGKGEVAAKKDVVARYIESANVFAGNDVLVDREILNSKVVAGRCVHVQLGKGMIAGGITLAGKEVRANCVGNINEPSTVIVLGISLEMFRTLETVNRKIDILQTLIQKIDVMLGDKRFSQKHFNIFNEETRKEIIALKTEVLLLRARQSRLKKKRALLTASLHENRSGTLVVRNTLYGNVDVFISDRVHHSRTERKTVTLTYETLLHVTPHSECGLWLPRLRSFWKSSGFV